MNVECILAVWGGLYIGGPSIAQGDLQPYIDSAMNELEFLLVGIHPWNEASSITD